MHLRRASWMREELEASPLFVTEPPGDLRLVKLPQVLTTPHLGASTEEAQESVAVEAAEIITAAGIDPKRRAETLTLEEWAALACGFDQAK